MVNHGMVLSALETVTDPELHFDIVSLNMVRNVAVEGGHVTVDVALTVAGCPLHEKIEQDVKGAVQKLPEVEDVTVHLDVMNQEERRVAFSRAFDRSRQASASAPQNPEPSHGTQKRPDIGPLPGQQPPEGMMSPDSKTIIIGIASGKGGVGKSTVTANLAIALRRLGARVGVMDMDIYGFSQGRLFGAEGPAKVSDDEKIIPWMSHDVALVSMGMFVKETQAVVWRGPMLGKMMMQFFQDVAWPTLDYLLVDLPPGTGDVALDIAQKVRKANLIMVTTPQAAASQVAHRAADVAKRAHQPIVGVIENMSYLPLPGGQRMEIFGTGGGEALAHDLEVPLLGQVPLEQPVREGGDLGLPVVLSAPESEAATAFFMLAEKIQEAFDR